LHHCLNSTSCIPGWMQVGSKLCPPFLYVWIVDTNVFSWASASRLWHTIVIRINCVLGSSTLTQLTKRKSWHNLLSEVTSVSLILDAGTLCWKFCPFHTGLRAAFTPSNVLSLTARVLICLANPDCYPGWVKCYGDSPSQRCISATNLCDGVNNCGNNWDEIDETCGWLNIIDLADWYVLINVVDWLFHSDWGVYVFGDAGGLSRRNLNEPPRALSTSTIAWVRSQLHPFWAVVNKSNAG